MRFTGMWARVGFALIGAMLLGSAGAPHATAATAHRSQRLERVSGRARLPLFTAVDQRVAAAKPMSLTIELKPTDAAALASEAAAISTPGSPDYGHYLSVRQFADRFGSDPTAAAAVTADLRASGMQVSSAGPNGLFLTANGTAAQVDRAFHTSISNITLENGRRAFANLQAPSLPAAIASEVTGVIGLDDIASVEQNDGSSEPSAANGHARLRDSALRTAARSPRVTPGAGPQPCTAATSDASSNGAYTIDKQASAYQLNSLYSASDRGAGQTIGLLENGGYNPQDLTTYFSCYGINPTVNPENVDGGPGTYNPNATDDGESAMDIEIAGAIAPAATLDVYQGPSTETSWVPMLQAAVVADQAKVISSSLAFCEPLASTAIRSSDQTLLEEAAAQGQSFFVSSGDSGAESCSQQGESSQAWNDNVNIDEPGAQPYATAVGGTSLFTRATANGSDQYYAAGDPVYESVWNDGTNSECGCGGVQDDPTHAGGASGGGLSADFAMPSYQQNAASSLGVINPASAGQTVCGHSYCREVPDISADADLGTGYVTYAQTSVGHAASWTVEAGTSASAPLWAGYMALVNADAQCDSHSVGFVNPALYQIAGTAYAANFNDPTYASPFSGVTNNDTIDQFGVSATADPSELYPSTAGYDMTTGIGTPIGGTLAASLCSLVAADTVSVTNPGTQTTLAGAAVSLQIAGTSSANAALSYTASGLPAGLSISTTGLITGTPTTAGTSSVTVTANDADSASGSTTFSWNVTAPVPPVSSTPPATTVPVASTPVAATTPATTIPVTQPSTATKASGTPTVTAARLPGLAAGKPKLMFTATAGAGNLKSVQVKLPAGLAFAKSAKALARDVSVRGSGKVTFTVSSTGRSLTIKLSRATTKIEVSVSSGALTESGRLRAQLTKKKVKTLKLTFAAVNSAGKSAAPAVAVKV